MDEIRCAINRIYYECWVICDLKPDFAGFLADEIKGRISLRQTTSDKYLHSLIRLRHNIRS